MIKKQIENLKRRNNNKLIFNYDFLLKFSFNFIIFVTIKQY